MPLSCPHCCSEIEPTDHGGDDIVCPACGSSFRVREELAETLAHEARPVGKFQLLERVGIGAFGAVWKARDTELGRIVAVKILLPSLVQASADRERFFREARAAAQLRHPGIVTVHEVTELDGMPAIVADFVHGVTLRDRLQVRRPAFREAVELVAQIADALDYAHSLKLVHRDVKPSNIMIEVPPEASPAAEMEASGSTSGSTLGTTASDASGSHGSGSRGSGSSVSWSSTHSSAASLRFSGPRALLLDFGLALRDDAEVTMTMDGQVIGTPAYMSPEQAAGKSHRVDRRSDIYSLGVVLFEMLTGERPFRGSKAMLVHQALHDEPQPPRRINHAVPRDLDTICLKAMAKSPSGRYGTARDMADDLRRWLRGEPIRARRVGTLERTWRWARRNPALAASLAFIAVLLVGATVASTIAAGHFRELANRETGLRQQAQTAEQNEAGERAKAEDAREETRRNLYYAEMNLAAGVAESPSGVVQPRELVQNWAPRPGQPEGRTPTPKLGDVRGWEWRLFHAISHAELRVIDTQVGSQFVAWSPDGSRIATGSPAGIAFWDPNTGTQLGDWRVPTGTIHSAEWSSDATRIALAGGGEWTGGFVQVRNAASGQVIQDLSHADGIRSVSWHAGGDLLAFHSWDNTVRVRNLSSDREVQVMDSARLPNGVAAGPPARMGFSPNGRLFASHALGPGYPNFAVKVWDAATWEEKLLPFSPPHGWSRRRRRNRHQRRKVPRPRDKRNRQAQPTPRRLVPRISFSRSGPARGKCFTECTPIRTSRPSSCPRPVN